MSEVASKFEVEAEILTTKEAGITVTDVMRRRAGQARRAVATSRTRPLVTGRSHEEDTKN